MSSSQTRPKTGPMRQSQGRSRKDSYPYSRDLTKEEDINDLRIQAIEKRAANKSLGQKSLERELNEEEIESQTLIYQINRILNQTEFDINNGEYIYKEHCNELRRQVQLTKETQIQKIEEISAELMNKIDKFETESLEEVVKVDKKNFITKLKEMKIENEKWNKILDEYKVDIELINEARESLSKIAAERDSIGILLHNKVMKFKSLKIKNLWES